jgi:hypothetical protein
MLENQGFFHFADPRYPAERSPLLQPLRTKWRDGKTNPFGSISPHSEALKQTHLVRQIFASPEGDQKTKSEDCGGSHSVALDAGKTIALAVQQA